MDFYGVVKLKLLCSEVEQLIYGGGGEGGGVGCVCITCRTLK